ARAAALDDRLAARRGGDAEVGRGRRTASRELKGSDARPPVEGTVRRDVFVGVPEGAVVDWIDRHRAVVAPATQAAGLGAGPGDDRSLALRHRPRRVAGQAACVANLWVQRAAADAVAESDISRCVLGDAAHPSIVGVRRVRALLEDAEAVAASGPQLVPPDADRAPGYHAAVDHERFVVSEVAVRESITEAVAK